MKTEGGGGGGGGGGSLGNEHKAPQRDNTKATH